MAFYIDDNCISCGSCETECAYNAISEEDNKYIVNIEKCTDCGSCAEVCPVDACHPAV
jgi:ferredoxin